YFVIVSAGTMARLDEVREELLRLADPRSIDGDAAGELIERLPAVVWLAYAVHGDESSDGVHAAGRPQRAGEGMARRPDRHHRPGPEPRRPRPLRRLA